MSKRTPIALLALFAATSIAGTAHAQPSSEPGERTGLSQINHTPIKVGEHSQYYYDYKKWNISGNPLGAMFGMYQMAVTRSISAHVALSGEMTIITDLDEGDDDVMSQLSFTAPIYLKKMHQGFYLEPGLLMRTYNEDNGDDGVFGPQVLIGWHWTWDSGANVQFAFGGGRNLRKNKSQYDDYDSGTEVFGTGYFRVGYAF